MNPTFSSKGISAKQNSDGSYTISGTPIDDDTIPIWLAGAWSNTVPLFTIPPGSYYSNVWIYYYDGKTRTSKKDAFTLSEPFRITGVIYSQPYAINERYDFLIAPQLELGTTATAYSPYREQLLTLPTPNGLPGIPVTSDGNYIDPQGQHWVCDEVDLERGVKVQYNGRRQVNTKNGTPEETHRLRIPFSGNGKGGNFDCIISVTPFTSWTSCVNDRFLYLKNVPKSDGSFYTGEELKALAIDVDFVYQLATPIETPLTPAEIAAYKALTSYAPDTVVRAGDGAGIKLDYQRDVNLVIKNLEDAIASMTTT